MKAHKGEKAVKALTLGLFFILTLSVVTVPTVFADEDEDDDDDEIVLGGGIPDAILYGTIAVIAGSVIYTGYRIFKTKRPKLTTR